MRKFNFQKDDLAFLSGGQNLLDTKQGEITLIKLGMEAYVLGVVVPKLGIKPDERVHVKYFIKEGRLEIYDQDEGKGEVAKQPLPDYKPDTQAEPTPAVETKEETGVEKTEGQG